MIELRDIRFGYGDLGESDRPPVLSGVDLAMDEGELVLVAGRTGVGKSTLLGVLTGLVPRFSGGALRGDLLLDGRSIIDLPPRERAHLIGAVGQDPAAGFVTDSVEEELAYGMEQLGLPGDTMRRRVEETLDLLGIADLRHRDLRTLSGGQQQRVAIGSVLTMHPRVLVLDEPTSALDPTAAEDVLATITRLVHDLGLTVVLAEHRLERVVPFADRMVLVVGDGTIRVGDPADVLATSPVAPPIVELGRRLGWDPLPLTVRDARRRASASSGGLSGVEKGLPRRREGTSPGRVGASQASNGDFPGTTSAGSPVLTARGLTVTHGRTVAVREVDLDLHGGRVTALMGRNGAGKSSLIWALQGSGRRHSGSVELTTPHSAGVGLVPQTAADLLYLESVAEECEAADQGAGRPAGSTRDLLARMVPGIDDEQHPRDLSEGQRLALVLAIVLATEPDVVLLDEPTRGLDYPAKETLTSILTDLAARGHAVLVASHDVEFVAHVADEVVVMAEGEVVSAGDVRRVLAESPSFAPQVTKILGPEWLTVDEVVAR